ncbi:MAG: hypothetical protein LZF60_420055 [Nitrospira sp.]|nr:FecR domain-containing protein [Nitrospira sp.]ULA62119.1 MAG: hypothetical protein LZF60_420055 [Nitrospira sp.]
MDRPKENGPDRPDSEEPYDAAVRWLLALRRPGLTQRDREAFEQWLHADSTHARAFERCRLDWEGLEPLSAVYGPQSDLKKASSVPRFRTRWGWVQAIGLAAALAAVVTMGVFVMNRFRPTFDTTASTQVAEQTTLTMTDGSRIDLNGRSKIRVQYYRGRRLAYLEEGEALFDVAKDADRPFIVDVGIGTVRVVGTAFQVTRQPDRLAVMVSRGEVRVEQTGAPAKAVSLVAGQGVSVTAAGLEPIHPVAADNIGTWRKHVLVFDRAPLRDVVTALQRQYHGTIRIDAAAADLPLTAVIQFSDIDTTLASLPRTLPVVVDHPLPTEWHIRRAVKS